MKKITCLVLIVLCFVLAACGKNSSTNQERGTLTGNEKFDEETMVTVTGKKIDLATEYAEGRLVLDLEAGIGLILSEDLCNAMKINDFVPLYQYSSVPNQMDISYMGEALMDPKKTENVKEEDYINLLRTMEFPLFAFYKASENEEYVKSEIYEKSEEIGTWNGSRYFIFYNTTVDSDIYTGLTDGDKQNINKIIDQMRR